LLYDVGSLDPGAMLAAIISLAAVAILACWFPARRATRVDPIGCASLRMNAAQNDDIRRTMNDAAERLPVGYLLLLSLVHFIRHSSFVIRSFPANERPALRSSPVNQGSSLYGYRDPHSCSRDWREQRSLHSDR
jgi:hypothetical protein